MKSKPITLATISIIILILLGFIQSNQSKFYYAYDEKVHINKSKNKLIVRYKESKKNYKTKVSSSLGFKNGEIEWKDDSRMFLLYPMSLKNFYLRTNLKIN